MQLYRVRSASISSGWQRRPTEPRLRPFCSRRCRDQDLLNWLAGSYAVPAVDTGESDAEDDQPG